MDDKLTIERVVPYTQELVIENQQRYFADSLMRALDRIVMQIQQLSARILRIPQLSIFDISEFDPVLPTPAANAAIGWNADADGFANIFSLPEVGVVAGTNNAVIRYSSVSGGLVDSSVTLDNTGNMAIPGTLTVLGSFISLKEKLQIYTPTGFSSDVLFYQWNTAGGNLELSRVVSKTTVPLLSYDYDDDAFLFETGAVFSFGMEVNGPITGTFTLPGQTLAVWQAGTGTVETAISPEKLKDTITDRLTDALGVSSLFVSSSMNLATTAAAEAHGLGGSAREISFVLRCTSVGELGYAVGDEVHFFWYERDSTDNGALAIWGSTTEVGYVYNAPIVLPNKTTGVTGAITPARWAIVIRARR